MDMDTELSIDNMNRWVILLILRIQLVALFVWHV